MGRESEMLAMLGLTLLAVVPVDPAAVVVPGAVAVIVAGQSNAAGRGEVLSEDRLPEPGVYVMKGNGLAYPGADPFDWSASGTGYGRTLARGLIDAGVAPQVWVVQCAVGYTPVTVWSGRVAAQIPLRNSLDGLLVQRAGFSRYHTGCLLQALPLMRLGVRVVAVAWHQGESGCSSAVLSALHASELTKVRDHFRADFPGVVFVGGELARSNKCLYKDVVNAAVQTVSDGFVTSEGLVTKDAWHFNRDSQREFGRRYADAILRLLN